MKKLWCVMAAVAAASAGADVTVFDGGAAKTAIEEGAWTVSGDFDLSSCGRLTVEFAEPLPQATRLEIQVLGEHPVEALSNGTGGGRDIGQFYVYSLPSDACTSLTVNLPPDVPAFRDVLNRMVGVRPWGLWRRLWKDPAMREIGSCKWWSVDPKRVKGVRVIRLGRTVASLKYPGVAPAIAVKRVTAHGDPARIEAKDLPAWAKMSADRFYPFLDRYGQFKWYDWPGKVRSDADLAAARAVEEKDLAAHPGPANRDKWGGWSNGPKRPADGTWRTAKENGKWWIVDPDGNLWWSHGVVRVSHSCGMSPVKGREDHFEGLPEAGDEFAAFYRTRDELLWPYYVKYGCTNTYDFTAANLRRKYGPDWENVWGERVHRRLRSWGANTIANSSDRKVTARGGTPYCDRFEIKSKPIAGTTSLLAWWPFRDPFDPSFRADIRRQLEIHRAELADPWCFGFFVDNELQWGDETDLAKWTWASPDDQAAKVAFKAWLKARHGAVPAKPSDDDCRAFSLEIVRAYFSTVREEVKAAAPGKLYLGCRFSGAEAFVIDEAQKYCDVMSFNHYDRDVKALVDSWPKGFDKPVMIGEFHFGALDRGPFTTGIISLDGGQAERAQTYVRYLTSALENPCIVGTHWHQYADDVSTGRFDGENMQIGWTDVCDTPYVETIAAVRDIGERMYAIRSASGAPLEKSVALSFGAAQLVCKEPGAWRFATSVVREADVDVVTVTLAADAPAVPPEFSVTFDVSGAGAYDVWTSPYQAGTTLYPSYWAQWRYPSQLAESLPLVSAFGHDTNVLTVASSEALRKVLTRMAFDPKTDRLAAGFKYFTEPEAPLAAYSVKMRLDRRRTFWADAVSSGADWMARAGGHAPAAVPSAAYEPLYSTWYAFWQDVHADVLERELAAAAKLGMKTAILDDGWQKEESRKYYSKTGDWQPVASRFPDMKGHVARVHRQGIKYMLWLSVPYVGDESAAWARFQGKFLHYDRGSGAGVLDPRFPEVREHLIATYERVIRDWDFDGLKLDFIDEFRIHDEGDPAVKENYAGRDIKSVPEATDRLMTDILARLRAIKPDVLVEFRQNYVGPAIRKYGNMLRAADVPYNYRSNRKRIADLRLTSGKTAVHSDMLGWSPEETPEGASLPILNTIFATVQYSMKLGKLPAEQQDVIRHWIDFARVHREALLLGSFEAHHAELGYPLLAGEGAAERIVGVYADSTVAKTAADKPTILLNATTASKLVVDFAADASVETFDCRGRRVGSEKVARGLSRLAVPPSGYAVVKGAAADGGDVVIENARFRLVAGADAKVRSLVLKSTGEECAAGTEGIPLFSVTQDRPFDNEMKLIHPNKRTTFPANALRREGNRLVVGFEIAPYEAAADLKVTDSYVEFRLADFIVHKGDFDDYLRMEVPPVRSFRVLQLPVRDRKNFGDWLNASWDEKAAVGVVGTSPYADIDHERRGGFRILTADLVRGQKLKGASAALVAANGREDFLDCMDRLERDFDLPLGVESRRGDAVKAFIYHVSGPGNPENIDRHIAWAKKGGFKYMTFHIDNLTKSIGSWGLSGDYDWNEKFPNGEKDVREMLAKVKAAGIRPGLHFLHTHIGLKSRYVTPVADPRLNKTRRFTLAKPVPAAGEVTELAVFEPTEGVTMFPACRILQFGGELFSYESYTTEPPYRFLGVKRGAHDTRAAAHPYGEVGGILDVSEYGKPLSCYVDQNTDLQDEVAAKIAKIYDCGFEYAYFDGSEGVNAPCNFHVSNAQYRQWKRFGKKPLFCEGAAKTHFDWHILSGANAFDCFSAETFKEELVRFPVAQAPLSWQDMTRVNFGWWAYWKKGKYDWWGRQSTGTKPDHWQFACSQCLAWDCPATVLVNVDHLESDRANAEACFEVMRLWGEARSRNLLTQTQKDMLKDTSREFHLSIVDGKAVLTEQKKIPER